MADPTFVAEIAELVRSIARLDPHVPIGPEARLIDDLGIDSLDLVGVFLKIQDDYNVIIDEMDVPALVSVGDLAEYVADRRSPAAA